MTGDPVLDVLLLALVASVTIDAALRWVVRRWG